VSQQLRCDDDEGCHEHGDRNLPYEVRVLLVVRGDQDGDDWNVGGERAEDRVLTVFGERTRAA
jgi:hypothetical protein